MLTQRNRFFAGDSLELVSAGREPLRFTAENMTDGAGDPIESTPHPMMEIHMKLPKKCEKLAILRKIRNSD